MKIKTKAELAFELSRSMAELKTYLRQYIQVKLNNELSPIEKNINLK